METGKPLMEILSSPISRLPQDLQLLYKDLVRGIDMGAEKKVELVLGKITGHDSYVTPGSAAEMKAVAEILYGCLQEGYSSVQEKHFELYTAILPVFTGFLAAHAKTADMANFPRFLFHAGEQFSLAYFDPQSQKPVYFDNFFEFHMQNIKDFLASPGFKAWRKQPETDAFLKSCIYRWMVHLGNFTRNRREKAFTNLLDLSLLLLKNLPELVTAFEGFQFVIPGAKRAFHFMYPAGGDAIEKILNRAHKSVPPELKTIVSEWLQTYNLGSLPDIPARGETQESPELTIPFVYRALMEEILGDGQISADEEWVIKSMRDFLEIANDRYNRIYEQVQEGRKLGKIPTIDRDFSPRVFLRKILLKTIEDGVVSDEEKAIIGKVANALLLSKDVLGEVFQEAKTIFREQLASGEKVLGGAAIGRELEKLHDLIRYTAMEDRIKTVLMSDRGIRAYQRAGKMLVALREKAAQLGGDIDYMAQWPVAVFFYEPSLYMYPVLMLFVDSMNVHPTRLEFKGGRIDVEILDNVTNKTGGETWLEDQNVLRLYNHGMDVEIPVKAVLVGETLQNFMEGLEETRGKYALMMMQHAKMAPILAIQKTGFLDFSGNLAQARRHLAAGKPAEAVTLLEMIHKGFPDIQNVLLTLGQAQEVLADKNPADVAGWEKAIESYRRETDLNSQSDQAMRAMGRLYGRLKNWSDALFWLNKARECAPGSIPNLLDTLDVWLAKEPPTKGPGKEPPAYVTEFLGEAFLLYPTHPRVVRKLDELNSLLGIDLVKVFRYQPVSTFYQ
jgi:tetratricopeptide (TPR) repeat protein